MRGLLAVILAWSSVSSPVPPRSEVDGFVSATTLAPTDTAEVDGRCKSALSLARHLVANISLDRSPARIETVFRSYDDLTALLADMGGEQYLIAQANPDKAIRTAAERCVAKTGDVGTDLQLSRPIYDRLNAIPRAGLDPNTRHVLERALLEFRLAGVDRDDVTRARIADLQKQITAIGLTFSGNVRDARGFSLFRPEQLAGMPADFMADHRPDADGKVRITTDYPDTLPVLAFADDENVRHAVYLKITQRAWPANEPMLRHLLTLRAELATLLGRRNAAEVALADKMVPTPEAAWAFIREANAAATPGARRAAGIELAEWRKVRPDATVVERWNADYVDRKLANARFDVDQEVVRRYFTYERVRSGVFQLAHDLFGADIRP